VYLPLFEHSLKGPCHEIFDRQFFSSNNSIWALDPRALFAYGFVFAKIFNYEIDFFVVSGVNDTADRWWAVSMTPLTRVADL
jgi:hypothetical protein